MAGIFPEDGVSASSAVNALVGLVQGDELADGCPDRWYRSSCRPMLNPSAQNALLSELIRIMTDRGHQYDCGENDNLSRAIGPHLISYEKVVPLPQDPYAVPNGADKTVVQGSFRVPNSSKREIRTIASCHLTTLIRILDPGQRLDLNLSLSHDNSYSDRILYTSIQLRNIGVADANQVFSMQTYKSNIVNIPAGGRTFYYRMFTNATAASSFELKEDYEACAWRFYGVSHLTADILQE